MEIIRNQEWYVHIYSCQLFDYVKRWTEIVKLYKTNVTTIPVVKKEIVVYNDWI